MGLMGVNGALTVKILATIGPTAAGVVPAVAARAAGVPVVAAGVATNNSSLRQLSRTHHSGGLGDSSHGLLLIILHGPSLLVPSPLLLRPGPLILPDPGSSSRASRAFLGHALLKPTRLTHSPVPLTLSRLCTPLAFLLRIPLGIWTPGLPLI